MQTKLSFEGGSIKTVLDFGNPQMEQAEDINTIYNEQMPLDDEIAQQQQELPNY